MIVFESFQPGAPLGESPFTFDASALAQWAALYPGDDATAPQMPPGMVSMIVMRAYMATITPRPPGNVHASQHIEMHRLPKLGETIRTALTCESKELRKERRWVHLASVSTDTRGNLLFTGRMTMIWAA